MNDTVRYDELREGRAKNGDGLFFQGGSWKAYLIRWWTNDEPSWYKRWIALSPYQHAEIVVWDTVIWPDSLWDHPRLCGWGSVGGGPRKTPLKRLIQLYNSNGGKVFYAPLIRTDSSYRYHQVGVEFIDVLNSDLDIFRQETIRRANEQWGCHYPNLRQWWRTGMRNWYKGHTDVDPDGTTCWEFVARAWGLPEPTEWYGKELAECGLVETPKEIIV